MSKLYIIGNGFDLKHGLPSRYSDFAKFCKKKNGKAYEEINQLFPLITTSSLWSNFEDGLRYVDGVIMHTLSDELRQSNENNDLSYKIDTFLKNSFREWITTTLNNQTENLQSRYIFDDSDCFVSFNYTNTLEKTYNISDKNILHLHGYAKPEEEKLFVGYLYGHNSKVATQEDSVKSDFINNFCKELQIDVLKRQIKNWQEEFTFDKIVILGHSLNKVDIEYFEELYHLLPETPWYIEFLNEESLHQKIENLKGIKEFPIELVNFIRI